MNQHTNDKTHTDVTGSGSPWGHLLVALAACVLTVSIVGSAVFLVYRVYDQHRWQKDARKFVVSLENRSQAELEARVSQLRQHPNAAQRYVLPEVLKALQESRSEQQRCSAIEISRVFLNHKRTEKVLFRLRLDESESVAAAAVRMLSRLEPTEHAVDVLGNCLESVEGHRPWDAVVDEVCAGLIDLGGPGLIKMKSRLSLLSADRRFWLVGYVDRKGGANREKWLKLLSSDDDERIRSGAEQALRACVSTSLSSATTHDSLCHIGRSATQALS